MKDNITKIKIIALAILTALSTHAEDMQKYLSDTNKLVHEGKYEEALERYIWFHDHALEHERSMHGVRLSFALMYWNKLGEKYPPALEAFKKVRDEKTQRLVDGKGSYDLFVDVHALNRQLGDNDKSIKLFKELDENQRALAQKCWNIADDIIIEAKDFELARKYIGDPMQEFEKAKQNYAQLVTMYEMNDTGDSIKSFNEKNFVDESIRIINVALAFEDIDSAKKIQKEAISILDNPRLKNAVSDDK